MTSEQLQTWRIKLTTKDMRLGDYDEVLAALPSLLAEVERLRGYVRYLEQLRDEQHAVVAELGAQVARHAAST